MSRRSDAANGERGTVQRWGTSFVADDWQILNPRKSNQALSRVKIMNDSQLVSIFLENPLKIKQAMSVS